MNLTGQRNQCPTCGEYFNSNTAFDKHRSGPFTDRRCISAQEMMDKGMSLNASGFWISESWQGWEGARDESPAVL
jgi:hypothetical protein